MLPEFEILQPQTVEEAARAARVLGDEACFYAGGTELLLVLKEKLSSYRYLIDLKTVPALRGISEDQGWLLIGSTTSHFELERSALARTHCPEMHQVVSMIANIRVRVVGTVGGNLCFGEPHSDLAPLLMALDAVVDLRDDASSRAVRLSDFFTGPLQTIRRREEVMTLVRVPPLPPGTGIAYQRFRLHERPLVSIAVAISLTDKGISRARVALGGSVLYPSRMEACEAMMIGEPPTEQLLDAVSGELGRRVETVDDLSGSADYKRSLFAVLARRALAAAVQKATGSLGR
jgi:carbon-monoxide dehydrogenase medium subunit